MHRVWVNGKILTAREGENLLELLRREKLAPESPCGGNGSCGKCAVTVDGSSVLSCGYAIRSDIRVTLPRREETSVLTSGSERKVEADPLKKGYLAAFDIGTTTVVCSLMSPEGEELAVESMLNPQSPWGADVITRIRKALSGGMTELTRVIREGMESLLLGCCGKAGIGPERIGVVSVAANPCMRQLFLGITPENLATVPYPAAVTRSDILPAKEFLPCCTEAVIPIVPDISGFVGTDTLSCVLAAELWKANDPVLLVDIGTNGEMVLAHEGRMLACSTAAGPALEGANIRFGMRGCPGAIDHVGEDSVHVIGAGEARGICGSGIVDAVAVMLKKGLLNRRGKLLNGQGKWDLTESVFLTQEDIRQVQMAKGAIAAGILLLCSQMGIAPERISRCILAGAFGSYMDPSSACRIGLLPRCLEGKTEAAGNIASTGAKMMAKSREYVEFAGDLAEKIRYLELASLPQFPRTFAKAMEFQEESGWSIG